MTMKVKIENLGPDFYTTVVNVVDTVDLNTPVITKQLRMGESEEFTVWKERSLVVSEIDTSKEV